MVEALASDRFRREWSIQGYTKQALRLRTVDGGLGIWRGYIDGVGSLEVLGGASAGAHVEVALG
jgi:hypothetical protein